MSSRLHHLGVSSIDATPRVDQQDHAAQVRAAAQIGEDQLLPFRRQHLRGFRVTVTRQIDEDQFAAARRN